MKIQYDNYELRPYSNGLCWELWEYKTVTAKDTKEKRKEWVSLGVYPSNLGHGLACIYERELMKQRGTKDLKAAITTAKRLHKELMEVRNNG